MTALNWHEIERLQVAPDIEQWPPEAVLGWALQKFSPRVALACFFQAEESVLIEMMHRLVGTALARLGREKICAPAAGGGKIPKPKSAGCT